MNHTLKRLALMLVITILFYLAGAVGYADFDLRRWGDLRGLISGFWLTAMLVVIITTSKDYREL